MGATAFLCMFFVMLIIVLLEVAFLVCLIVNGNCRLLLGHLARLLSPVRDHIICTLLYELCFASAALAVFNANITVVLFSLMILSAATTTAFILIAIKADYDKR
jgi:hypothetical protein